MRSWKEATATRRRRARKLAARKQRKAQQRQKEQEDNSHICKAIAIADAERASQQLRVSTPMISERIAPNPEHFFVDDEIHAKVFGLALSHGFTEDRADSRALWATRGLLLASFSDWVSVLPRYESMRAMHAAS